MNIDEIKRRLLALEAQGGKELKIFATFADGSKGTYGVEDFIGRHLSDEPAVVAVEFPNTPANCGMLPSLIAGLITG